MPVAAIDAQSLEQDHRSAGEHLKSSTRQLQPLQPISRPLGTQLKCLYANACSMVKKQEELETCAWTMQGYDLGITETW